MLLIYEFQLREHEKRKPATARMMGISVQSVDTSLPCHQSIYNEDKDMKERRK